MMCHRCTGFPELAHIEGALEFRVVAEYAGDVACALDQINRREKSVCGGGCGAVMRRESTADLGAREHAGVDEHFI